jgi:hypothetical protein
MGVCVARNGGDLMRRNGWHQPLPCWNQNEAKQNAHPLDEKIPVCHNSLRENKKAASRKRFMHSLVRMFVSKKRPTKSRKSDRLGLTSLQNQGESGW